VKAAAWSCGRTARRKTPERNHDPSVSLSPRALRADCANCAALCCVAPGFSASADFAIDKAPGQPCPHLDAGFRCSIHAQLRPRGFPGCAAYDCFGAGQHVTQSTFGGSDWRRQPGIAAEMFASFAVMRPLHELLWYVTEALALDAAGPVHADLAAEEVKPTCGVKLVQPGQKEATEQLRKDPNRQQERGP